MAMLKKRGSYHSDDPAEEGNELLDAPSPGLFLPNNLAISPFKGWLSWESEILKFSIVGDKCMKMGDFRRIFFLYWGFGQWKVGCMSGCALGLEWVWCFEWGRV